MRNDPPTVVAEMLERLLVQQARLREALLTVSDVPEQPEGFTAHRSRRRLDEDPFGHLPRARSVAGVDVMLGGADRAAARFVGTSWHGHCGSVLEQRCGRLPPPSLTCEHRRILKRLRD